MKKNPIVLAVLMVNLVAGGILRIDGIGSVSFSNDELSSLNRTQYSSWSEMFETGVKEVDYHPAGVQTFLYFWTNALGSDQSTIRLPFVLFGIFSVLLVYLIGRKWGNERVGLIAAALMAALAFPILYSRLARPYSIGVFFCLLAIYFWSSYVRPGNGNRKNLIGFIVAGVLASWSHYYAAVLIAIVGLLGLVRVSSDRMLPYVASGIAIIAIAALHWPITSAQLANEGIGGPSGWLDAPGEGWLFEFVTYAFNGSLFFWIMVSITALGMWFSLTGKGPWRKVIFLLTIAFAHYLFGSIYSDHVQPILQYSGLLFSFPLLLVAIALLIDRIPDPTRFILPVVILVGAVFTSMNFADHKGEKQFGKFHELAEAYDEWSMEHGRDVTFAANVNEPFYLNYYLDNDIPFVVDRVKDRDELFALREALENSMTTYFAFCWSTIQMPLEVYSLIRQYYPTTVDDRKYFNSQATLFKRGDLTSQNQNIPLPYTIDLPAKDSTGLLSLEDEYSPGITTTVQALRELSGTNRPIIELSVNMRPAPQNNPVLVMEWFRKGKRFDWVGSDFNEFYPSGRYNTLMIVDEVPEDAWMDDELKMYIWKRAPGRVEIRGIEAVVRSNP